MLIHHIPLCLQTFFGSTCVVALYLPEVTRIGTHDARAETKVIFLLGTFIYITFEGTKPSWFCLCTQCTGN